MKSIKKENGSIKDAKKALIESLAYAAQAKKIVKFLATEGRTMLTNEELDSLKDLVLVGGNDFATMDSFLGQYRCMSFGSRKFAVESK